MQASRPFIFKFNYILSIKHSNAYFSFRFENDARRRALGADFKEKPPPFVNKYSQFFAFFQNGRKIGCRSKFLSPTVFLAFTNYNLQKKLSFLCKFFYFLPKSLPKRPFFSVAVSAAGAASAGASAAAGVPPMPFRQSVGSP